MFGRHFGRLNVNRADVTCQATLNGHDEGMIRDARQGTFYPDRPPSDRPVGVDSK